MCTLDILGYTSEQFEVVPFLVLMKTIEKVEANPTEANKRMLLQVKDTCSQILIADHEKLTLIIERIVNFVNQPDKTSSRT